MTRFEQELFGTLGVFWKKEAEKEITKMEERYENGEILFGKDNVVRWISNGKVMPKHCREILSYSVYADLFDEDASAAAEEEETAKFFESYRESRKNYVPSEEELFEMRAAFGTGTTVVDVITGKEIRL